jgi:nitrate reductase gamma subunit
MDRVYLFLSGPLTWAAFAVLVLGSAWRVVRLVRLARIKDAVVFDDFRPGWASVSILRWLLPLNVTAATRPLFSLVGYGFHVCLLCVAIFLSAHVALWEQAFGLTWPTLPDELADWLTLAVLGCAAVFAVRRVVLPRVRALTNGADWLALMLAAAPFVTGYAAHQQWWDYELMLCLHVASGLVLLAAVPFTKLSHVFLFFVSRAVAGSDFGKRKVGAW